MTTIAALSEQCLLDSSLTPSAPPGPGRSVLTACFLGEFRVAVNQVPVPLGSSRRTRSLLAFLIDRGARPTPRDLLMEVFWPSSPASAARNNLHVAMCGVRKALALAWEGTIVECRGDTYRLSEQVEVWSDVTELERRCEEAAQVSSRGLVDEATNAFESALALYGGEFLADDPYLDWALDRREELRLRAVTCAERLSELHLDQGDLHRTLVFSNQVLREEPCHEPVARRLMVAYARLGQPHMALRQYERIVNLLDEELGVRPATETVTLAEAIRRREPV